MAIGGFPHTQTQQLLLLLAGCAAALRLRWWRASSWRSGAGSSHGLAAWTASRSLCGRKASIEKDNGKHDMQDIVREVRFDNAEYPVSRENEAEHSDERIDNAEYDRNASCLRATSVTAPQEKQPGNDVHEVVRRVDLEDAEHRIHEETEDADNDEYRTEYVEDGFCHNDECQ